MTSQMVLTMGSEALTLLLMIAMPVLGVVMAVGLVVSIFQAVTQIHEATLAFVPKLIAAMVVFAVAVRRTMRSPPLDGQRPSSSSSPSSSPPPAPAAPVASVPSENNKNL